MSYQWTPFLLADSDVNRRILDLAPAPLKRWWHGFDAQGQPSARASRDKNYQLPAYRHIIPDAMTKCFAPMAKRALAAIQTAGMPSARQVCPVEEAVKRAALAQAALNWLSALQGAGVRGYTNEDWDRSVDAWYGDVHQHKLGWAQYLWSHDEAWKAFLAAGYSFNFWPPMVLPQHFETFAEFRRLVMEVADKQHGYTAVFDSPGGYRRGRIEPRIAHWPLRTGQSTVSVVACRFRVAIQRGSSRFAKNEGQRDLISMWIQPFIAENGAVTGAPTVIGSDYTPWSEAESKDGKIHVQGQNPNDPLFEVLLDAPIKYTMPLTVENLNALAFLNDTNHAVQAALNDAGYKEIKGYFGESAVGPRGYHMNSSFRFDGLRMPK